MFKSDSSSTLMIFKNSSLVLILLRNQWHNACSLGVQVISSHIFREGNCCVDKLVNMGHLIQGIVWLISNSSAKLATQKSMSYLVVIDSL